VLLLGLVLVLARYIEMRNEKETLPASLRDQLTLLYYSLSPGEEEIHKSIHCPVFI